MKKTYRVIRNVDAYLQQEAYVDAESKEEAEEIAEELDDNDWLNQGIQLFDNNIIDAGDIEEMDDNTLSPEKVPAEGYLIPVPAVIHVRIKAGSLKEANEIANHLSTLNVTKDLVLNLKTNGDKNYEKISFDGVEKSDFI